MAADRIDGAIKVLEESYRRIGPADVLSFRVGLGLHGNAVANAMQHGSKKEAIVVSVRGESEELLVSVHNKGVPTTAPSVAR
jgi:hypothetical protein